MDMKSAVGWKSPRCLEMKVLVGMGDGGAHRHWRWKCPWSLEKEVPIDYEDA